MSEDENLKNIFNFPQYERVPKYVAGILDHIHRKFGSGSVVSILGFNEFRRDSDVSCVERIFEAAASNFFIPLLEGTLDLTVTQEGVVHRLTNAVLEKIVHENRENRRKTKQSVLRGESVFAALDTYKRGIEHLLTTNFGNVRCFLRLTELNESTKLLLFRNGMFITDDIPANKPSNYSEYKRFNCVLNVEPQKGSVVETDAFQLVRRAEGEKHLDLDKSRLVSGLVPKFESLFQQVFERIREQCIEDDADAFTPDIFGLEYDGRIKGSNSGSLKSRVPTQSQLEVLDSDETGHASGDSEFEQEKGQRELEKIEKSKKRSRGPLIPVDVVARRRGQVVLLHIRSQKKIRNGMLKLDIHGGSDLSCDIPIRDQNAKFVLKSNGTTMNAEPTDFIPLGAMQIDSSRDVELEIVDPPNIPSFGVLKISVVEIPLTSQKQETT